MWVAASHARPPLQRNGGPNRFAGKPKNQRLPWVRHHPRKPLWFLSLHHHFYRSRRNPAIGLPHYFGWWTLGLLCLVSGTAAPDALTLGGTTVERTLSKAAAVATV